MQQNTPEWLEYRKTKIGASDAPILMNCSPWSSPYDLWMEKKGMKAPKKMTPAMQRGIDLRRKYKIVELYELPISRACQRRIGARALANVRPCLRRVI